MDLGLRLLVLLVVVGAAGSAGDTPAPGTAPPNVLVLMSYHRGQPWEDGIAAGLIEALGGRAEPVFIHFDHKRFPQPDDSGSRLAAAIDAAERARPALIIAVDDHAWAVAMANRARLGADLPVVFCGLNHWQPSSRPRNTTGVVESFDVAGTLDLAFALHPQARRLFVLNDATDTGRANRATFETAMPAAAQGRQVHHIGLGTWAETESILAGLDQGQDLVLMLTWNLDASGLTQAHEASVRRAHRACPVPIYGVWDFQFGQGIIGGSLFDGRVHGSEAGELALRVLGGVPADAVPVQDHPRTRTVVDGAALALYGIGPAAIPAGVEVIGLQPGFWSQHGTIVLVVLAVFLAQAATICWLWVAMARRRRSEAARQEAEARLRVGSRMDAVGQLAAGVAHDFNNVLTAILGHADLLSMRLEADSPLRTHAETIAGASQRAAGTVRNLLAFARGRSHVEQTCEANRLVQDVVALLQHAIDRRITVACQLDGRVGSVRIGADELQQILVNLALNARDAMPGGGQLNISTSLEDLQSDAGRLNLPPGSYVLLTVVDTGCGIAPEHLERIFDPFFTTKEIGKGTGLGLSVVHGAVAAAHGAVRVVSQLEVGTTFRIYLPAGLKPVMPATRTPGRAGPLRVMLVDDERVVLDVVGQLLQTCGATVEPFDDPLKAAAWFASDGLAIDLAILDGNMPGVTGWQLAAQLKEVRPELRIIALTGAATAEAQAAWLASGITRVLQKPVSREQVMVMLTGIGDTSSGARPILR